MNDALPSRDLVLVGAGHTNAHILRMWRMQSIPDVRLTVVSPFGRATYSGMLPGTLAGLYEPHEMEIDLHRLCATSGARLIVAEATGLDPRRRRILLEGRPPIRYDIAAVGIGSVPAGRELAERHPEVLSIKPMATFLARLDERLARVSRRPVRIHVAGAGAAGTEVTLCLDAMLRRRGVDARLVLLDAGDTLLSGYREKTRELARRELERRGIPFRPHALLTGCHDGHAVLESGERLESDVVILATRAAPPPVLDGFELPKTNDGFLAVRSTLRTTADHPVFVVGDTATIVDGAVPKAGVYAVREGPVLWDNIRRLFRGDDLRPYDPQADFLSLLATGDGKAILQYRSFSTHGTWAWHVKDFIDRRFMDKHRDFKPMTEDMMEEREQRRKRVVESRDETRVVRCRGCGGKVGASILSEALSRLDLRPSAAARFGLDAPDDAAVLACDAAADVVSVDFFQAFLDDPYLVGRVAALNALSDLHAMNATPVGAMAMITLPEGSHRQQAELLYQLLAGGVRELEAAGTTLLGGHTTESAELTVGYTVLGRLEGREPYTKGNLRPGDALVLTKPLGTGTLLVGHMLAQTGAAWMEGMLASMLCSNAPAASVAREFAVTGVTDITGFGIAGHLLEMLDASGAAAEIDLDALPLLAGYAELAQRGVRSSLDPDNREVEARVEAGHPRERASAAYHALFDPQTSGGLLIAVEASRAGEMLDRLRAGGYAGAAIVGRVAEPSGEPVIRVGSARRAGDAAALPTRTP